MGIGTIFTGIGAVERLIPVIETISTEIGPVIKAEVADGEILWADFEKSLADLKAAFATARTAIQSTPLK